MGSKNLYNINEIDINEISDSVINLLRRILGIKKYLDDTEKLNEDSSCIIAIAISMIETEKPFPFQIENWKRYVLDYLKIDYAKLLDNFFGISRFRTKRVVNEIKGISESNNAPVINKFFDKKINLFKHERSNNKYSYNDLDKVQVYEEFKFMFKKYIEKLDTDLIPLAIKAFCDFKKADSNIIYFLLRIALDSWTYNYNYSFEIGKARKFMLALENKRLKNKCNYISSKSIEYINSSKKLINNKLYNELESEKLLMKIYCNTKYSNPKQLYDKRQKELNEAPFLVQKSMDEKIKKSIKYGGLQDIRCEVYMNNNIVNNEPKLNDECKYVWEVDVLVDEEIKNITIATITRNKLYDIDKLDSNVSNEFLNYNMIVSDYWVKPLSYKEKVSIINMIFDKYNKNPNMRLLLEILKKDDLYNSITEYIELKEKDSNVVVENNEMLLENYEIVGYQNIKK